MSRKYHQKKDHNLLTIFLLSTITFAAIASTFFLINDNETKIPQKEVTIILDTNKILTTQNIRQDGKE